MRINTFSIVIGNKACNAKCGFCISRMTGFSEVHGKRILRQVPLAAEPPNFTSAVRLARIAGTTTVLLTGKGEPTLDPNEITQYLQLLNNGFPFIELQTNGLSFGRAFRGSTAELEEWSSLLRKWRGHGLNTIAISVVSTNDDQNAEVYHQDYPSLRNTIIRLHQLGFTVRLSLMLVSGIVDSPERLKDVISWCRENAVEQLTIRSIRKPDSTHDKAVSEFVLKRGLTPEQEARIVKFVDNRGKLILQLSHGAKIYDLYGQNICLTDCLTIPEQPDHIRTLIYYSNGRLAYDWQHSGAVLLGGQGVEP